VRTRCGGRSPVSNRDDLFRNYPDWSRKHSAGVGVRGSEPGDSAAEKRRGLTPSMPFRLVLDQGVPRARRVCSGSADTNASTSANRHVEAADDEILAFALG